MKVDDDGFPSFITQGLPPSITRGLPPSKEVSAQRHARFTLHLDILFHEAPHIGIPVIENLFNPEPVSLFPSDVAPSVSPLSGSPAGYTPYR